jgi:hypothetical protein
MVGKGTVNSIMQVHVQGGCSACSDSAATLPVEARGDSRLGAGMEMALIPLFEEEGTHRPASETALRSLTLNPREYENSVKFRLPMSVFQRILSTGVYNLYGFSGESRNRSCDSGQLDCCLKS